MPCTLCVFSVLSFWEWAVRGILAWSFSFVYQGLKQRWVKNELLPGERRPWSEARWFPQDGGRRADMMRIHVYLDIAVSLEPVLFCFVDC